LAGKKHKTKQKHIKMDKYKGLKIATIYGQGLEGCGVTRTTAELELWAKKTGATVHTYAFNRKYTRTSAHEIEGLFFFGPSKKKDVGIKGIAETAKKINDEYDVVMFMNYPNAKSEPDIYKGFYFDFFEVIQKPQKAVYIHEIRGAQFNRLAYLVPMIVNADIVFHFDTTSELSQMIDGLGLQKIGDRLHKYTLWMNFDDLDRWRLKYLNNKTLGVASVTRWSSSKNVRRTIDIMDVIQQLRPNWDCQVHGIERSMGAKIDVLDYEKTIYDNGNGKIDNKENGCVMVHGPVDRNVGVDIVASHTFSTAFWSMPKDPENYGNRMEYTQIEIIGAGTIPILDKHWGQHNHTKDGTAYYDIPYSAVYVEGRDEKEIDDVAHKLIEIAENPELMKKYLEVSHALVVEEFGADTVIPEAIDRIKAVGKNKNQMSIFDMCVRFGNISFAEEIKKLESAGKQPVFNMDAFTDGNVAVLEDSKEVFIKKIKKTTGGKTKNLF
jgi:glycosyltransferase involved in cell wall biosynthesis